MRRLILTVLLVASACATETAGTTLETMAAAPISTSTSATPITTSTTRAQPQAMCQEFPSETPTCLRSEATTTTLVPPDGLNAAERVLVEVETISGGLAAKSVAHNGHGLFLAQNMMYLHTISVFDRDFQLLATISDEVTPSEFGHGDDFPATYRGSPVEAAFTSDGRYAYVSNYRMYGGGLNTAASDGCNRGEWPDSFVYRVDTESMRIDQLLRVGPVPKFLVVTPDDRYVLVSNWCGFDVSVLDVATGSEIARVEVGRHPRGIAVDPESTTAYVAVMGSRDIAVIDLSSLEVSYMENVGSGPRHLVMSPEGSTLYASLNGEWRLAKIDLETGEILATVATGSAPRSMTVSDDGTALYVVNYESDTLSKVRTEDMVEIAELGASDKPIGITYDAATRQVWVSAYSGTIQVFQDIAP